jgi:mannose-1-phosphate guanylyltransferase/mannose-6-phosphate isomerase
MNLKKSYKQKKIDGLFVRPNKNYFKKVKSASIDYAVMENFKKFNYNFLVGTASFYWNDMGTWRNVYEYENTNVNFNKNTINIDSDANSILTNNKLVVTLGVKNILVVENDNNLLIANKDKINLLKDFKKYISNKNKSIFNKSSISYRPWGYFRIIDEGYGFKVKKIHVFPKSSLSLQSHEHRTEHWIVINGEAKIIKGNKILILKKNESTFIHFNQIHRLINEKDDILEIIEIQSGDYLGEDDIKRYEDNYGR